MAENQSEVSLVSAAPVPKNLRIYGEWWHFDLKLNFVSPTKLLLHSNQTKPVQLNIRRPVHQRCEHPIISTNGLDGTTDEHHSAINHRSHFVVNYHFASP